MRLYSYRFHPADGELRSCYRLQGRLKRKRRRDRNEPEDRVQPYQSVTFAKLEGESDRLNLVSLETISRYVFCTPRCYTTKEWEVGVCNSYTIQLLVGGSNLASHDLHLLMVFEQLQSFLQYLEIREQTNGYFYLPDDLSKPYRRVMRFPEIRGVNLRLDGFRTDICSFLYGGDLVSATGLMATLNLIRHDYFNGIHTTANNGPNSVCRIYRKVLGKLFGAVRFRTQSLGLVTRQYYGHMPLVPRVSLSI